MSWVAVGVTAVSAVSANEQNKAKKAAASKAASIQESQSGQARADLSPYRQFGENQIGDLQNWLSSDGSVFSQPSMQDIQNTPGYDSRLGAVENSAAAKGSLFSGNALRKVGEFGASEYSAEMARRQNELNQRLALTNVGQSAAAGSANISQNLGNSLSSNYMQQGQNQANMYGSVSNSIGSGVAAYQAQKNWNRYLDRIKK